MCRRKQEKNSTIAARDGIVGEETVGKRRPKDSNLPLVRELTILNRDILAILELKAIHRLLNGYIEK